MFQIGLKAGRDLVEGMKSRDDPAMRENSAIYLLGASTDFVIGQMYDTVSEKAYDEIVRKTGMDYRESNSWTRLQPKRNLNLVIATATAL